MAPEKTGIVGAMHQLEHAQGVGGALALPAVSAFDGDAEHLHGGVVEQHQHGLHGGVAGAVGVLVDDDEALLRDRPGG